ncbi:MAG: maltotransferase domain-containing protein, partial [Gemmatimonadaceae bacterium]
MPPQRRSAPSRQLTRSLPHIAIEYVRPELDAGRFAPKRIVGDRVDVGADIFKDGHDLLAAHVRVRGPADADWRTVPMTYDFNSDRWSADFAADAVGTWRFTVEAWTDRFATWRSELQKKVDAGYDVSSEVLEGAQLIDRAARKSRFGPVRTTLKRWVTLLRDATRDATERAREAFDPALHSLIEEFLPADDLTTYARVLSVRVARARARFAAWSEMFPRSQGTTPGQHATLSDLGPALRRIAGLGFDVVYLPPIHP